MEFEIYKKLKILKDKHKKELNELYGEYAMSNNKIKKCDIIEDKYGVSIIVEKIGWKYNSWSNKPDCIYSGAKLTKKGKPFKNGEIESAFQSNIIAINGVPVEEVE